MTSRILLAIAAAFVLGLAIQSVHAHTTLAGTTPKTGSVLAESPPVVEITFREAASLTSVTVVEAGKAERKLAFTPVGSATAFRIQDPLLGPGRSEIHWKALSMDGHVISGTVVLTIDPTAAKTH